MQYIVSSTRPLQNPDGTMRAEPGSCVELEPDDPTMAGQWHRVQPAPEGYTTRVMFPDQAAKPKRKRAKKPTAAPAEEPAEEPSEDS